MDSIVKDKLQKRLAKMRLAAEIMVEPDTSAATIETLWEEFITAAGGFYSVLEQASKATRSSKTWFGRKKGERRSDPLLKYVHQARNAEEHGIRRITDRHSTSISLASPGASVVLESDGKSTWTVKSSTGSINYAHDVVKRVRVRDDRFGDEFDPPEHHLGKPIEVANPHVVASIALAYMEDLFSEASAVL